MKNILNSLKFILLFVFSSLLIFTYWSYPITSGNLGNYNTLKPNFLILSFEAYIFSHIFQTI